MSDVLRELQDELEELEDTLNPDSPTEEEPSEDDGEEIPDEPVEEPTEPSDEPTEDEKVTMLRVMLNDFESPVSLLNAYLLIAAKKIIARAYPYDTSKTEVPERYELLQAEIAAYLINKRGAEGQTAHTENGITRMYENADVPASMMKQIVPMTGVPFYPKKDEPIEEPTEAEDENPDTEQD